MTESPLDRPGVVTLVGERAAAGVPEHVRMGLQFEASADRGRLDHPGKARGREWPGALTDEDDGWRHELDGILALQEAWPYRWPGDR